MNDPREIPVPETADEMEKAEILARDLAYGRAKGDWNGDFSLSATNEGFHTIQPTQGLAGEKYGHYLKVKWPGGFPKCMILVELGYLEKGEHKGVYRLTMKAFGLLKKPASAPPVFISYRRAESSAFVLLVEVRLKMAGIPNPFVDKNLRGGEEWHARLQAHIEQCQYLICLVGPSTLDSEYVRKEIRWAYEAQKRIIPVCHNGQTLGRCMETEPMLASVNGYEIKGPATEQSAADYEAAVNFILNSLGCATY